MDDNHRGCREMFPYDSLDYRTTIRTSTGATPYLLVYGTEAPTTTEVEIQSLRIIQETELLNGMIRAFHKRVRTRIIKVGQLILKNIFPHQDEYKGIFAPNLQGPYMVRKVLSIGSLAQSEKDGTARTEPINSDAVKTCYT
ncbi:uncharacterized protein [Solanum lycopersicum]|uniref:uncharacterized protein n=1 Tax=Solanum lycopersicum TaxID=4081 RepID=UPI00374A4CFF